MTIKSYFANAVDAAIRQAREELGPDAMLIESRAASPEMRRAGKFEVVFGVLESPQEETKVKPPPASKRESGREDLAAELKMLRSQITELRKMMQPTPQPAPAAVEIEKVRGELIAGDLDPEIAAHLMDAAETIWNASKNESLRRIVEECIRRSIQTAPDLSCPASKGNIIAFVGPPGAGKTTALAKIAVQHCLARRRSVRIVSVDTERVGGHELLRAYSNVLGIGFSASNSLADVQDALSDGPEKTCVLVDTPGFGAADKAAARDLATLLGRTAEREVHLVLPASMKRVDAAAYSDQFAIFKPGRLLFTKLDEASSPGSILSETLRLGLPLSFFSIGQGVPEDLMNADPERLIARLFPASAAPAVSAA